MTTCTIPNKKNFCGGNFPDWLEVYLTAKCNGKCSFCIEKHGFKPKNYVPWEKLAKIIVDSGKRNILLLGGEPTLYFWLIELITYLKNSGLNVCMTTNGSSLMIDGFVNVVFGLKTLNISIHHYDPLTNKEITGIKLYSDTLKSVINQLQKDGTTVRINCNIIKGYIDSKDEALAFIDYAKYLGVDGVRFAELKWDDRFVDLADIFPGQYGLNKNPFIHGCWQNAVINDMPVNFRQLCGMQSDKRPTIANPKQILKKVLYYDGKMYDGWQSARKSTEEIDMNSDEKRSMRTMIEEILESVEDGEMSTKTATTALMKLLSKPKTVVEYIHTNVPGGSGSGCVY